MKNYSTLQVKAASELLRRRSARLNFWSFCVLMDGSFFNDDKTHLKEISKLLQSVSDGKIKKLMISMPPRAGKSYTVSLFCAWLIGKDPTSSIMRNSYGQTLAEKFSYDIREIIKMEKYLKIFPNIKLKQDKRRVDDWAVEGAAQSSYFCAGVGGAITGKGCKTVAILDDPIKNLEDALSETIVDKTWSWYTSTHKSRLESGCPEIQIATRWSKKDPIGMLLDQESDKWTQIKIPALQEGKSFCNAVKTTDEYLEIKKLLDEFIWEAEFMQEPIESKGLLFPEKDLQRFSLKELNDIEDYAGYVDTADEGTDYLCSPIGAIVGDKVYIVDVIFTQDPIELTEALVAQQVIKYQPFKTITESNFGGKSFAKNVKKIIADYNNELEDKRGSIKSIVKWKANTTNKETRILMKSGEIKKHFYFRNDYEVGSDYDKFMRQLTSYVKLGKNKHDDAPDALTGLAETIFIKKIDFLR